MDSQRPTVQKTKKQVTVYLDSDDMAKIANLASVYDNSVTWIIRQIIHSNIDKFAVTA